MTFLFHAMLVWPDCLSVRLDVLALGTMTEVSAGCWRSLIPAHSSLCSESPIRNEKVVTWVWSSGRSFSGWNHLETLPNKNLVTWQADQLFLSSRHFHVLPWQIQAVLVWHACCSWWKYSADVWWVPVKSWNFPQSSQLMKRSEEVKSSVSFLWGLQVVMEWCWKSGLHDTAIVCSSMASHLWWTFPSTSLKCPQELQQIHCSVDGVGCLWHGKPGRIQGTAGIPWNCSMVHCHFWTIPSSFITACVELFGSFLMMMNLVK